MRLPFAESLPSAQPPPPTPRAARRPDARAALAYGRLDYADAGGRRDGPSPRTRRRATGRAVLWRSRWRLRAVVGRRVDSGVLRLSDRAPEKRPPSLARPWLGHASA